MRRVIASRHCDAAALDPGVGVELTAVAQADAERSCRRMPFPAQQRLRGKCPRQTPGRQDASGPFGRAAALVGREPGQPAPALRQRAGRAADCGIRQHQQGKARGGEPAERPQRRGARPDIEAQGATKDPEG